MSEAQEIQEAPSEAVDAPLEDWGTEEGFSPEGESAEVAEEIESWDELGEDDGEIIEESEAADSGSDREDPKQDADKPAEQAEADKSEPEAGEAESSDSDKEGSGDDQEGLIEVKVDGEIQKVELQELKNNYAGKVAYDKKFNELSKERNGFKAEVDKIQDYIADLGKTMKESSTLEGLYKVGELAGIPPHVVKANMLKEILPEIERLREMTSEQIDLEYKNQEIEHLTKQRESEQQKREMEQAQQELQSQISRAREAQSISEEEWDDAVKLLDKELPREEIITVEKVEQRILDNRASLLSEEVLSQFGSEISGSEEYQKGLKQIVIENRDFTKEDLVDIMNDHLGIKQEAQVEETIKEVAKQKEVAKPKQKQQEQKPGLYDEDGNEIEDWDEIL